MKRIGIFVAAAAIWLVAVIAPSLAEEGAFNALGFSANGSTFAYESFGIDEDGTPYWSVVVVDTRSGAVKDGAAVQFDDADGLTLTQTHTKLKGREDALVAAYAIDTPAVFRALTADGEGGDDLNLSWSEPQCCAPRHERPAATAALTLTPVSQFAERCTYISTSRGDSFTLAYSDNGITRNIDSPEGFACGEDYHLYAVMAPIGAAGPLVAIVSGFARRIIRDGRDFIAVPLSEP